MRALSLLLIFALLTPARASEYLVRMHRNDPKVFNAHKDGALAVPVEFRNRLADHADALREEILREAGEGPVPAEQATRYRETIVAYESAVQRFWKDTRDAIERYNAQRRESPDAEPAGPQDPGRKKKPSSMPTADRRKRLIERLKGTVQRIRASQQASAGDGPYRSTEWVLPPELQAELQEAEMDILVYEAEAARERRTQSPRARAITKGVSLMILNVFTGLGSLQGFDLAAQMTERGLKYGNWLAAASGFLILMSVIDFGRVVEKTMFDELDPDRLEPTAQEFYTKIALAIRGAYVRGTAPQFREEQREDFIRAATKELKDLDPAAREVLQVVLAGLRRNAADLAKPVRVELVPEAPGPRVAAEVVAEAERLPPAERKRVVIIHDEEFEAPAAPPAAKRQIALTPEGHCLERALKQMK